MELNDENWSNLQWQDPFCRQIMRYFIFEELPKNPDDAKFVEQNAQFHFCR